MDFFRIIFNSLCYMHQWIYLLKRNVWIWPNFKLIIFFLVIFFFYIFREYMEWPQQLYESGMNIEIVATASMASYGILKRLEWVATIWLQPILEDGICMFSTNTISIREFYKKETEIRSTSNTNPRYVYVFTFLLCLKQWWVFFAKKIVSKYIGLRRKGEFHRPQQILMKIIMLKVHTSVTNIYYYDVSRIISMVYYFL